jgi:hypothetical protein
MAIFNSKLLVYQRVTGNIPTGAPEPLGISTVALVISGTLLALTTVRAAMERVGGAGGVAAMSSNRPLRSKSERNGDSLRFNGYGTRLSEAFCIET